ncbi:MAG: nitrous oxide reductase accessory protein NosL [Hyphomicrobium denitrificans]|nr:nitrous oxide reductase accessory protein NosL [Hyphomicrobium denitrificans]
MTRAWLLIGVMLSFALAMAGCREKASEAPPPPQHLTADATGHYCGMALAEHPGPKGQIILASRTDPVWFSSARDAFAFTILAEESKDVRAIYVSDMGKAQTWDKPGDDNWVDARQAFFVVDSRKQSGMGAPETVPFSDRAAADKFAESNGGRVLSFSEVPHDYVLTSDTGTDATRSTEAIGSP